MLWFHGSTRRKLLEARRTRDDYDTAKRSYDKARHQLEDILNTWNREQHSHIQENWQLLERASDKIVQKAHGSINQAIAKTLQDHKLGDIQLEESAPSTRDGVEEAPGPVSDLSTVFW